MKNNFFTLLKNKLEQKPSQEMDQQFWQNFDRQYQFEKPQKSWLPIGQVAAVFSLVIIGVLFTQLSIDHSNGPNEYANAIMMEQDLLEDIEMIEFMAQNNLSPEEMALLMEQDES